MRLRGRQAEDELLGLRLEFLRDVVANPAGAASAAEVADVQRDAVVFLQRDDAGGFALDGEGFCPRQREQIDEGDERE